MSFAPVTENLSEPIDRDALLKLAFNTKIKFEDRQKLLKILARVAEGDLGHNVQYSNKQYGEHGHAGRLYAVNGASKQGLSKDVRKALSLGERDVDMMNANASMMVYLLHKHDWVEEFGEVVEFCELRDSLIAEMQANTSKLTREQCKELFNGLPMGLTVEGWCTKYEVQASNLPNKVKSYGVQLQRFVDKLLNLPEYKNYLEIGESQKEGMGDIAAKASALTFLLQDIEQLIMRVCREDVRDRTDGAVTLPMHDGFQTNLSKLSLETVHIPRMQGLLSELLGGDFIKLVVKPMDDINQIVREILEAEQDPFTAALLTCMDWLEDTDLAVLVHTLNKGDFVFTGEGINQWHGYEGHRWKPCDDNTLKAVVRESIQEVESVMGGGDRENSKDKVTKLIKALKSDTRQQKVVNQLKQRGFMYRCREEFYDKLDRNFGLWVFNNGVYDFLKHTFRPGSPSDLATISCGWDYTAENNENARVFLDNFYEAILPNPEVRQYRLALIALSLGGYKANFLEQIYFLQGLSACNGKDTENELIRAMFGSYYAECAAELLTCNVDDSSKPRSDVEALRKSRYVSTSEPAANKKLQTHWLKKASGGGTLTSRQLYGQTQSSGWPIQFTLHSQVNDMPQLQANDDGILRRLRVVPYPCKFCPQPDPNEPFQKQLDPTVKHRMQNDAELCQEFFLKLVDVHRECVASSFLDRTKWTEPQMVKDATNRYMRRQDMIAMFIEDRLDKTDQNMDRINTAEVHRAYAVFCEAEFDIKNAPITKEAMKQHKIDSIRSNGWKYVGIQFKALLE